MHIDNITSEKITLNNDGKAMQISVYEKEIERLNNIINELERYIEEIRLKYCNELSNQHNCTALFIENSNKLNHIVNIKLKLEELKEKSE